MYKIQWSQVLLTPFKIIKRSKESRRKKTVRTVSIESGIKNRKDKQC